MSAAMCIGAISSSASVSQLVSPSVALGIDYLSI
jgi:hypothetical protein